MEKHYARALDAPRGELRPRTFNDPPALRAAEERPTRANSDDEPCAKTVVESAYGQPSKKMPHSSTPMESHCTRVIDSFKITRARTTVTAEKADPTTGTIVRALSVAEPYASAVTAATSSSPCTQVSPYARLSFRALGLRTNDTTAAHRNAKVREPHAAGRAPNSRAAC